LFVTSTLLVPKRWVSICLATTIGFTLGATVFAFLVQHYGMELVEHLIPGVTVTQTWSRSEAWIHHYGVLAVGGFSLLPLAFHPLIAIAALQKMSIFIIAGSVFLGRLIKYAILGWFCAFLPAKLPFAKKLKNGKH
jgi:membrane protein YqaA with SNARE-associated domain